jgi:hypothetical protein
MNLYRPISFRCHPFSLFSSRSTNSCAGWWSQTCSKVCVAYGCRGQARQERCGSPVYCPVFSRPSSYGLNGMLLLPAPDQQVIMTLRSITFLVVPLVQLATLSVYSPLLVHDPTYLSVLLINNLNQVCNMPHPCVQYLTYYLLFCRALYLLY